MLDAGCSISAERWWRLGVARGGRAVLREATIRFRQYYVGPEGRSK
ncbi:MAG: hypothetical protein ACYTEL_25055 [Planctomycetota bacterium]